MTSAARFVGSLPVFLHWSNDAEGKIMEMIFSMVALHRLHNSMSVFSILSESQHFHFHLRIPPDRFKG